LYALSAENLDRNDEELEHLYELIRLRLEKLYKDPRIHRNKMRVKGIGRIELLPESIKDVLQRLDDATKGYDGHFLNIALAYGGQFELVDAVKKIGEKIKDGTLNVSDIDKKENQTCIRHIYLNHHQI
jgi:tritrans,polycis-undecaprenyl-diphosphate synthase [geranylgeranyl-diphosphate specific]